MTSCQSLEARPDVQLAPSRWSMITATRTLTVLFAAPVTEFYSGCSLTRFFHVSLICSVYSPKAGLYVKVYRYLGPLICQALSEELFFVWVANDLPSFI